MESTESLDLSSEHYGSAEHPPKRARTAQLNGNVGHRSAEFWDCLSKVHLTRGALREFGRRSNWNSQPSWVPATEPLSMSTDSKTRQLKRFARHGGPNLDHIRGAMIDSGIYPHDRNSKPNNLPEVKNCLPARRDSLSSSQFAEAEFEEFVYLNEKASSESCAIADVFTIIEGKGRHKYNSGGPKGPFNHLEPLSKHLPHLQPDSYDGVPPEQVEPQVRKDLGTHIVPCNDTSRPAAPNFFEGKSASGRADAAKLQACHAGGIGTRGMHSLENYKSDTLQYSGNMDSFSSTYQPENSLKLYGHHMTPPQAPGGPHQYHMTQLGEYGLTHSVGMFREGASAYRDLRDFAEKVRNSRVEKANPLTEVNPETSEDGLTIDINHKQQRCAVIDL